MKRLSRCAARPIAAALISFFGLASIEAVAAPPVTNCADDGTGSLRAAVTAAATGDSIDLTQLQCSPITLTTGAISVLQDDLTISGPGSDKLSINGNANGRNQVFSHFGAGTLAIDHLRIAYGYFYTSSTTKYFGGGCIGSFGNLKLSYASVDYCRETVSSSADARGGGVFAFGNLSVDHSVISNNQAYVAYYGGGGGCYVYCYGANSRPNVVGTISGGGLFAKGDLTVSHSTITGNYAAVGGGIYSAGTATISYSTVSKNSAFIGAGIMTAGSGTLNITSSTLTKNGGKTTGSIIEGLKPTSQAAEPMQIYNSTVTGNGAESIVRGANPLSIYNSTIAFNNKADAPDSAAVSVSAAQLNVVSSIIAENNGNDVELTESATIVATHSLINSSNSTLPAGTLSVCPGLFPLDDNGGETQTLALKPTSAAIGIGSNPLAFGFDQRGSGFVRTYQVSTDIGAFEWNANGNRIFASNFQETALDCDVP